MLQFCVNRVLALQELQAIGRMAAGFQRSGCYQCPGIRTECEFYTPFSWVYETEAQIPHAIAVFLRKNAPPADSETP